MQLSEVTKVIPVSTKRDGIFRSLGILTHSAPEMLVFLEAKRWVPAVLRNTHVSCVITSDDIVDELPDSYGVAVTAEPRKSFIQFHNYLAQHTDFYWREFPSEISPDAQVHPTAYVAPTNVRIGRGSVIEPRVTILERCLIGENVIIRAGSVLGSEGFYFSRIDGAIYPFLHAGGVLIHNDVEIQANCAIDKAVFGGFTEIGESTKLDNHVHIAHNVRLGKQVLIAASAMLAGSVTVGDGVWIGPSAAISSEVTIGDRARITLGAVVVQNVEPDKTVTGNFAIDHRKFLRFIQSIKK